jgi:hypothetical protein
MEAVRWRLFDGGCSMEAVRWRLFDGGCSMVTSSNSIHDRKKHFSYAIHTLLEYSKISQSAEKSRVSLIAIVVFLFKRSFSLVWDPFCGSFKDL